MSLPPLQWMGIAELAKAFREGEAKPTAVTRASLERIEALDPKLRAFATLTPERAIAAAQRAEAELAAGRDRGPLHGVPIGVKDLCDMAGVRTAAGMRIFADRVPDTTACVVERLEAAGAIVLGKLTLTEGAYGNHHPDVVPPKNPWNAERWSGVSSSGSGVAVAAGMVVAAIGSDTGGSIRFPSAANGVVGLKPTYGRVPRHGVFPLAPSLDHIGPMARTVADTAVMLAVMAGGDDRDPTSIRGYPPDLSSALEGEVAGLRIGVDRDYSGGDGVDDEVSRAVFGAEEILRKAGAEIVDVSLPEPWRQLVDDWGPACAIESAVVHAPWFPAQADDYGPAFRALLSVGGQLPATLLAEIEERRRLFRGRLAAFFEKVDALLCPALATPTPPAEPEIDDSDTSLLLRFTAPFDFSGSPTLTLPCEVGSDGMPIALQIVADWGREDLVVRVGQAFETRSPVRGIRPSV